MLVRENERGELVVRMRGLVLKADKVVAICPRCRCDVPFGGDFAKALQARLFLAFNIRTGHRA